MTRYIRTDYNYDMDAESLLSGLACEPGSSMTQQEFKEECDINTIVRNFGLTGELPNDLPMPMNGDFSEVGSYQEALNLVREADQAFMLLPAEVRSLFDNEPQKFIDFAMDPANKEQCIKYGLHDPDPVQPSAPDGVAPTPSAQ